MERFEKKKEGKKCKFFRRKKKKKLILANLGGGFEVRVQGEASDQKQASNLILTRESTVGEI